VLAYVAQQAVEQYHWLNPGEMLDGLGMAETTPGPLIVSWPRRAERSTELERRSSCEPLPSF